MEMIKNHDLGPQIAKFELQSRQVVPKREPECPEGGSAALKELPQQFPMTSQDTPWDPLGRPSGTFGRQNKTICAILGQKSVTERARTRK
jgi:hypothetical protein